MYPSTKEKQSCTEISTSDDIVQKKKSYLFWQRSRDFFLSLLALVGLSPFLLIIAIIIYIDDPHGSPIFSQVRCGKDGKLFKLYKFRSMCINAEAMLDSLLDQNEMSGPAFKIKNDPRITRIGRFIRKTSIDELPQLVNVLRGEMSIVGPRPPLPREVAMYDEYQRQRLAVKPGLTCYWQIQPDRNSVYFDDWLEMDLKYIREQSLWVDWKIILKTITVVCRMHGE